jgi:hypothetical protein
MFENRVLKIVFGRQREGVKIVFGRKREGVKIVFGRKREGVRGKTKETTARSYAICCSSHVIKAIESVRTRRRAWYVARIGGIQNAYEISVRTFECGM